MKNTIDLRDLGYFEEIATVGHLGRAAERLGRSQPALSKCVDRLEDQLGHKLFERVGRTLRLTQTGEVLLAQAKIMRRTMDDTVRHLAEHGSGIVGTVHLGVSPASVLDTLPRLLRRLLHESPHVKATVFMESSNHLRAALREGTIDLIVGPTDDTGDQEFVSIPLVADPMVVAARPGHAVLGRQATLADLTPYQWLLPNEAVESRRWLDHMHVQHGLPIPRVQVEANATLFLRGLVAGTDLLTFISRSDLAGLAEIDVPPLVMCRSLGVMHRRSGYLPPLVQRVISLLSADAAEIFRG